MAVGGNEFDREGVTSSALREAMRCLPSGVAVVSAFAPSGDPRGITVGSLVSASLVPPLVLWCLGRDAVNYQTFAGAESFAAHILGADQEALALHFADAERGKWGDPPWRTGPVGTPLLDGCQAILACHTHTRHDCGDHLVIVGRVLAIEVAKGEEPLIHHGGDFRRLA
jgi:flavin reductase (DIM6/NTAB) family NADH-FMN oxidoreductase RutF